MTSKKIKSPFNEKGATLVEVIASFVILVILLVSFFTLFIQTKQTTKSSAQIVDATYLAQTEMEEIYKFSKDNGLTRSIIENDLGFKPEDPTITNPRSYTKPSSNPLINLRIADNKNVDGSVNNDLMNVIVEVKEGTVTKAKMETVVKWKVD
ncbi:MAG TPA: type II secretion system protein [Rummeliibacillus sp.]|nr:type II secretion system protein [Rummeliibacillus sp.]